MPNDDPDTAQTPDATSPARTFLDRLSHALLGEPSTREELVELLRDAEKRNLLDRDSLDMIEGALAVSQLKVRDIMIPRARMDVVDKNTKPDEYLPTVIESGHSRFPLVDGDKDKVVGILLAKDLLKYFLLDKKARAHFKIQDMLRPAVFVPESKRLNVLLREFRASRNHMAIVVDEYGGVAGLVTIEDVIEQIVGDIKDEYDIDADDVYIVQRGDKEFFLKAPMPLDDFNARFGTAFAQGEIDTVGGWLMATLGRVPRRGESLEVEGFRFEVLRADSRRIHLLKLTPLAPTPDA
jgi:magnesium and cobalt transporter